MTSHPNTPPGTPCAGGVPAALLEMRHQISDLAQTLWAARRSDELIDTVIEAESLKSTLEALVLDVIREIEAKNAVKPIGWASTQDFLTAVSGGHKGSGPATVRLAKALDAPLFAPIGEGLKDGWLSTAKAQVIVRNVDELPGNTEVRERAVAVLLEQAKGLDPTDLAKAGRRILETVDPDGQARREEQALAKEERAAHLHRDFWMKSDHMGGFRFGGQGSEEDGAKLRTTLMSLAKPRPADGPTCDAATCDIPGCSHDGRDPRDHGARMYDALIELCDKAARASLLPECHGVAPRVSVTIDYEDLKEQTGWGTTDAGEDISAETLRRMACDAEIIPTVLGTKGQVLDVGRTARLVTAAIWLALTIRDKHCRFPNCTRPPAMCHAHHLIHWINGGKTSLENLILLCGHHHRLIHAGPWEIRKTGPNDYAFEPPPGTRRMSTTGREPPDD